MGYLGAGTPWAAQSLVGLGRCLGVSSVKSFRFIVNTGALRTYEKGSFYTMHNLDGYWQTKFSTLLKCHLYGHIWMCMKLVDTFIIAISLIYAFVNSQPVIYVCTCMKQTWASLLEYSHVPFSEEAPKSPMRINFLHKGTRSMTASKQGWNCIKLPFGCSHTTQIPLAAANIMRIQQRATIWFAVRTLLYLSHPSGMASLLSVDPRALRQDRPQCYHILVPV